MNHCVPDWNMEDDSRTFHDLLPTANQRKSTGPEHELVELLWQNGHVVMHSQTHRKPTAGVDESKQAHKSEPPLKSDAHFENSSNMIQEEETASWLQYSLDDSLEKEFCSDFFYGLPTADSGAIEKPGGEDVVAEDDDRFVKFENTMPPPKPQVIGSTGENTRADSCGITNFSHFSRPAAKAGKGLGSSIQGEVGESSSSMVTKGSSINCGSNRVQNPIDLSCGNDVMVASVEAAKDAAKDDARMKFSRGRAETDTHEATLTSSSGGSECSFGRSGRQIGSDDKRRKRKGRDADESECQSEETEYGSVEANRPAQQSASARRSRAAEVHNLSERRRRDRINEKMKALQELIPHCNKSDKASMLDEAIEYLKSLQLQVQIMWMGSGMAPMMLPGVQHYMSRMGIGMGMSMDMDMGIDMGHDLMTSIHGPVPFPRVPLVNQSMSSNPTANQAPMCPTLGLNPVNFPNQMQNACMPESYARYLGFHHMQPSPQAMNLYTYGSELVQRNQTAMAASSSSPRSDGRAPSENVQNGRAG